MLVIVETFSLPRIVATRIVNPSQRVHIEWSSKLFSFLSRFMCACIFLCEERLAKSNYLQKIFFKKNIRTKIILWLALALPSVKAAVEITGETAFSLLFSRIKLLSAAGGRRGKILASRRKRVKFGKNLAEDEHNVAALRGACSRLALPTFRQLCICVSAVHCYTKVRLGGARYQS